MMRMPRCCLIKIDYVEKVASAKEFGTTRFAISQAHLRAWKSLEAQAVKMESQYDELNLLSAKGERDGWSQQYLSSYVSRAHYV